MSNPLLARYAECIFWLARFVERAENLARILEINETYSRDSHGSQNWRSIVQLNADEEPFSRKHSSPTADNVIRFYVTDADNPTSILAAITGARENARTLRPLVSTEMWVQLNVFHQRLKRIDDDALAPGKLAALFTEIKLACQTFTGITEGTFYRDQAWYFYRLGLYIERADQTTRLLDAKYHVLPKHADIVSSVDVDQWHALLRSASGYHAFRRIHSSNLTPARVVGFLMLNPSFPRSVYLCVREVAAALTELKSRYALRGGNDVAEGLDQLRSILATLSIEQILGGGLHEFVDFMQRQLIAVTIRLSVAFFGHEPAAEDERFAYEQWTAPAPPLQTQSQGRGC